MRIGLEVRSGLRGMAVVLAISMLTFFAAAASAQEASGPDRGGFTLLLNLGIGFQHDRFIGRTESGLAGLNLGIGGFLTEDLALMFRASGTNVDFGGYRQVSGVGGPTIQYWLNDHVNIEGGAGLGFWGEPGTGDSGLGLILGLGYAFFNRGKHNLQIGVEYAPAFTEPEMIHNVGIVFGWQLL